MSKKIIVHLVYRFDIGGLESVLVNMINKLPEAHYRHVIISLTNANRQFIDRLQQQVDIIELDKPPGNSLAIHLKLFNIFRDIKPDVVHTYNFATLEYQFVAMLAGAGFRVHAEHGRDIYDLTGSVKKYQIFRKLINPFVNCWVAVSRELSEWLVNVVKLPDYKVKLVYNGIDTDKYLPKSDYCLVDRFTVATVGRLAPVKDQIILIKAVEYLVTTYPHLRDTLCLKLIGDGELRQYLSDYVNANYLTDIVSFIGASENVANELQTVDVFVLSSLAEGIPLTMLEAMATALPVIATRVGGNPELITDAYNGFLVSPGDYAGLGEAVKKYADSVELRQTHGLLNRNIIESSFSLQAMVGQYQKLYSEGV